MKRQHGLGTMGNIFVLLLLAMGVLLVFKMVPPYMEYFTIQRIFRSLAVNPGLQDGKEVKRAFERSADIDNVTAINKEDIEISNVAVSANYRVKVPLFGNINLLLEFNPSSAN